MVEIFKTNFKSKKKAKQVISMLEHEFPDCIINFDLEDCDKILRIETSKEAIDCKKVIQLINDFGFNIEVLSDSIPTNLEK